MTILKKPDAPPIVEWFGREYVDPYYAGAAAAFGIIGMAEAIRSLLVCGYCYGHTSVDAGCCADTIRVLRAYIAKLEKRLASGE